MLYNNLFIPGFKTNLKKDEILQTLLKAKDIIIHQHNGLFLHMVNNLINKIEIFGLHFTTLDIRQESTVHEKVLETLAAKQLILPADYTSLSETEKIKVEASLLLGFHF